MSVPYLDDNQFNQDRDDEEFRDIPLPTSEDQQIVELRHNPAPHPDQAKILQEAWEALCDVVSLGPVS